MRHTDIAIVGGGLAGSTAAAMLGRAGIDAVLIDPHPVYPPDFRCEKLDASQVHLLQKTGLADAVLPAATLDGRVWIARLGHLVEKRRNSQYDILYDTLVNTVRAQIPQATAFIHAKANTISTSADRQQITLSNDEEISARLVVLANGLNTGLRQNLGMAREIVSANHSISIGFDLKPVGRTSFDFPALTYYPERPADRMAYLTLFPIGATMRGNLFVYRDMHDLWFRRLREAPQETLFALMQGLQKLTGEVEVVAPIKIRPVDLYVTQGYRQPGIVLVGDAFGTSCPAAGTGVNKVLTDVERLCSVHLPRWLASAGMGPDKIAAYYDDEVKQDCDSYSAAKAHYLRSLSIDAGLSWRARRWGKLIGQLGVGALRQTHERLSAKSSDRQGVVAGSGARP
jgi:2-polyprenyl-6-methoxyphenol hydroxylase-like FAD-dependent oxidoreductase